MLVKTLISFAFLFGTFTTFGHICPSIQDLTSHYQIDALDDFRNERFVKDIPFSVKAYFQNCLTQKIPSVFTNVAINNGNSQGIPSLDSTPRAYASLAPFQPVQNPSLPNARIVFEKILKRGPAALQSRHQNAILFTFIDFLASDVLRSKPESGGSEVADSVKGYFLYSIYGQTSERQQLLRLGKNGKLRTSFTDNGDEVALMWKDVPASSRPGSTPLPGLFAIPGPFVLGYDSLNRHWGHIFWTSTFTLLHNKLCDMIITDFATKDGLNDNEIFTRTRVALTMLVYRTLVEEYFSNGIGQGFLAGKAMWRLNPQTDCSSREFHSSNIPLAEYNHISRWHNMVPDKFDYVDEDVHLKEFSWSLNFTKYSLQEHYDSFYRTKAGVFFAHNIPSIFANVTIATIEAERRMGLGSFNDMIEAYGLPRLKTFAEFAHHRDDATANLLTELYNGDVDSVELIVGMMVRPAPYFSLEMLIMLTTSMLSDIYSNNHFCSISPQYYTEEHLGEKVHNFIFVTDRPFLELMSDQYKLNLTEDNTIFTYTTEVTNVEEMPSVYNLNFRNVNDYVGLNLLWPVIIPDSRFVDAFLTAIITSAGLIFSFGWLARLILIDLISRYSKLESNNDKENLNELVVARKDVSSMDKLEMDIVREFSELDAAPPSLSTTIQSSTKVKFLKKNNSQFSSQFSSRSFLFPSLEGVPLSPAKDFDLIVFNILVAIIYAVQMVPYSFGVMLLLFSSRFDLVVPAIWPFAMTSLCVHMILYVVDIAIRFKYAKFNYLLLLHHMAYCVTVFVSLYYKDVFSIKFVAYLDAFITFEFGLFALMAYSKLNNRKLTPKWRLFGQFAVFLFIITRILQTIVLIYCFVLGYGRMKSYGYLDLYTFDAVMATTVSVIQGYTVVEYMKWKTLWGARKSYQSPSAVVPVCEDT
jgi:hypothetical protein